MIVELNEEKLRTTQNLKIAREKAADAETKLEELLIQRKGRVCTNHTRPGHIW